MNIKLKLITILSVLFLGFYSPVFATVYFPWDSENQSCNAALPFNYENYQGNIKCGVSVSLGDKCLEWNLGTSPQSAYMEIDNIQGLPFTATLGRTYYLAFYVNFVRINGNDIWHEFSGQSYDKVMDLKGNGVTHRVFLINPGKKVMS